MKKKMKIAAILLLAALCTVLAVWFLLKPQALKKELTVKGYQITVPEGWTMDSSGALFAKNGKEAGRFLLVTEKADAKDSVQYAGVTPTGDVQTKDVSDTVIQNTFQTEACGKTVQYFIKDIPNPDPYAAVLTLYYRSANRATCEAIAKSFTIPEIGKNAPKKDCTFPLYDEIGDAALSKYTMEDETVEANNISLLEVFIDRLKKGENTGLDIVTYRGINQEQPKPEFWYHIESDGGKGFLYTYYDKGDGVYTYDNNPQRFDGVTKKIQEEEGITSYHLKLGETETTCLLEIPTNPYRDYAEELLALQTDTMTEETLRTFLGLVKGDEGAANIMAEKEDKRVTMTYSENIKTDPKTIAQDAAVLFSLSPDVDTVTVKDTDGKSYVMTRENTMNKVEDTAGKATQTTEDFVKFAEEIEEKVPPAKDASSSGGAAAADDGVAPGTVVFSTAVTVPEAYREAAEARGYGHLVGQTVYGTIKKTENGYIATATCGGSVIASMHLADRAAVNSLIATARAYGG